MIEAPPRLVSSFLRPQSIRWLEIVVVLLFAYVPSAFSQAFDSKHMMGPWLPYYEFFGGGSVLALLLLLVWITDRTFARIGLTRIRFGWDLLIGLGLCMSFFVAYRTMVSMIPKDLFEYWYSMGKPSPIQEEVTGKLSLWTILPPLFVINMFEEVLMRGYLTSRLMDLLPSKWSPVFLSSIIFAMWHVYEGPLGVMNAFTIGLILGAVFVYTKRLWPLIIAHFTFDAIVTLIFLYASSKSGR